MGELPSISDALIAWTGWRRTSWPQRDELRLAEEFGSEQARELMPKLRELEEEFYSSDARLVASSLAEMGQMASEQFRCRHPELSEEAVRALAWCYTFDFK